MLSSNEMKISSLIEIITESTKYFCLQSREGELFDVARNQRAKIIYLDDFIVELESNFQSGFLFTSVPATLWPAIQIHCPTGLFIAVDIVRAL